MKHKLRASMTTNNLHGEKYFCTFISKDEIINEPCNKQSMSTSIRKHSCQACAWKEEQLRIALTQSNGKSTSSERVLQQMADVFLSPSVSEGLVKPVKHPLNDREIRYASLLSHAIQCKTISHDDPSLNDEGRKEILKLHRLLQESFPALYKNFPPELVNDYSLLFKIPGQDEDRPPIMLCSHLDVVPPGNDNSNAEWKFDPFGGYIKEGIIWGRGAIDNKHNVISQLGALEEILTDGGLPMRALYIAIGHDEEIQGYDGARFLARRLKTENVKFDFILDEGTMCVSGAIPGYKEPVALIGYVEKGYMNVELTVCGKGGHSSIPPLKEDNPIKIMSKAILALESNHMPPHFTKNTAFRNTLEYIADKVSFPFNFIFSNLWFFGSVFKYILIRASNGAAASVRTTTVVTKVQGGDKINSIPTKVTAYVNHRIHPNDSIEKVLEHDRNVINDDRVQLQLMDGPLIPSPVSDHKKSKGFHLIEKSVKTVFGFISAPSLCIGNTDTRWYWDLSENIYRFSPVPLSLSETSMFHGFNERISIKTLISMVDFYKEILLKCDE
mmetsp:Transcript_16439/g.31146  ORF Transcript_16439/g.31146 Transcript_16439/m.31146 type:complete len:556 (-) Transcript_16439:182-1849(-)